MVYQTSLFTRQHLQLFDDWPQCQCGNKRERADEQDRADNHHHKQRLMRRQCAGTGRGVFLTGQRSGNRQRWNHQPISRDEHRNAECDVVERFVRR